MAVISPSLDIRLSAISTPTNTPSGTVNVSVNGMASANKCATVAGGAELRTRISNSRPDPLQEQYEREQHRAEHRAVSNFPENARRQKPMVTCLAPLRRP